MFYYFSKMAPTGYSLTVNVDVTKLKAVCKENNIKFFPAYLWLATKNLNRQTEFKVAEKDGVLGFYDTLTPLYAAFHEDDKTISFIWTEYSDDFRFFSKIILKISGFTGKITAFFVSRRHLRRPMRTRFPVCRG